MREGSLEAPVRHPVDWQNPDFYDEALLDAEMRRVFDVCHGCRRCFNLCDSFPRLFDLVDHSPSEELDTVESKDFAKVVDACTLCDMCFLTKCPYVPPHPFNLDIPHLMLRYRAVQARKHGVPFAVDQMTRTDRNGRVAGKVASLVNWATATGNRLTRRVMEKVADIDAAASLPKFQGRSFVARAADDPPAVNPMGPAAGRKAVFYATCFVNFSNPGIGQAAQSVLAHNGVATDVAYPACCGMPQLEQGRIEQVVENAGLVARHFSRWIDQGYDVIALVPSCALMLKFEWLHLVPADHPDRAAVERLSKATFDIAEYIVDIAQKEGLAPGLRPLEGGVTLHIACHARAQNMGQKAAEMLRLIPRDAEGGRMGPAELKVVERCSGHGGSWGVMKGNFETALKVGKPVASQAVKNAKHYLASECPLAGEHIRQGVERLDPARAASLEQLHPVEIFARAYGL
ncbi:(Fe-S)-binding protein [Nitrospirillum amazonense]|uniref:Glycerol-3-phosphate dehydrogenase subunit C n=1 Tax=Nitrospirillum amazonense TaxID=28077 RepID=A0A560JW96_9PROT|nr:heterodisulfide reductase-related iron-sulfur binding cluster [Nitrospirillum amazonense]MDG3440288.1 heterodisulfide reductase-related iron-sulfur binding cluster [Nitrospirillum amazonense]TWB75375.1 glycerol-3-phosphate dehydrogenase subunit C [Nitrospirillum amazonense]